MSIDPSADRPAAPPSGAPQRGGLRPAAVLGAGMALGVVLAGGAGGLWYWLAGPAPKRVEIVVGPTNYPDLRNGVPAIAGSGARPGETTASISAAKAVAASPLAPARLDSGAAGFVAGDAKAGAVRTIALTPGTPNAAPASPAAPAAPAPRVDAIAALLEPPPAPPPPAIAPKPVRVPTASLDKPAADRPAADRTAPERPQSVAALPAPRALPAPVETPAPAAVPLPPSRGPVALRSEPPRVEIPRADAPRAEPLRPDRVAAARPKPAAPTQPAPQPTVAPAAEEGGVDVFGSIASAGRRIKEAADTVGDTITSLPSRF